MREVFCKKNPFRPSSQPRHNEGCPCPRAECDTQSCGLASHRVCVLPTALSPSTHGKGGQKEPGQLLHDGDRAFALVSALHLPGKENTLAWSPQGTSPGHRDWGRGVQRPRVACPSCHPVLIQLNILGRSLSHAVQPAAKAERAAAGRGVLRAAQMCIAEADGFPHVEIYDLLKSPQFDGCFFISYKSNYRGIELIVNIFREWARCCLFTFPL